LPLTDTRIRNAKPSKKPYELIRVQRLGAGDFRHGLFWVDRAQHSSLGFVSDLLQERGLSLVWFSES